MREALRWFFSDAQRLGILFEVGCDELCCQGKKRAGVSAEGPRNPGLSCPPPQSASKKPGKFLLFVFFAAQEFVALDRGHYANGTFVARFGALNASEATNADGSGKGNFIRQGQEDFDRRAFLYILGQEEVDPARADVPRFRAGFSNCGTSRPADGKRKAHLKALCGAAFGPVQRKAS